jgi:hypothetical protein
MRGRVAGMPPVHKGRPQQWPRRGSGCDGGSISRDPAGPPYSRPHCLSLHIGPLGICSRFADRGLSVFVIRSPPRWRPFLWATRRFKNSPLTQNAPKLNNAWWRSVRTGNCNPPVWIGTSRLGKGSGSSRVSMSLPALISIAIVLPLAVYLKRSLTRSRSNQATAKIKSRHCNRKASTRGGYWPLMLIPVPKGTTRVLNRDHLPRRIYWHWQGC